MLGLNQVTTGISILPNTYYDFQIFQIQGTTVGFFMGNNVGGYSLMGYSTTNLPSAAQSAQLTFGIYKGSTMSVKSIFGLDYVGLLNVFPAAR